MFQHLYFVAINIIADSNPSVGFKFSQKLLETNEICLSGCLDHVPIVKWALPNEKELSTPKKVFRRLLHKVVAINTAQKCPVTLHRRLQT